MALRRFIIERDIPKVGTFEREQLRAAAAKSNEVLGRLSPDIQRQESFVVAEGIFGRLFGYGTVTVNGTGGVRAPIARVEKPLDFRRNAVAAVDAAQSQGTLRSQAA